MMVLTPFKSDIFYSVQNEDFQTELAVIDAIGRKGLRVLTISSSGENALSILAHPDVEAIYAVDVNPAQRHLCILRETAVKYLDRDSHLRLFAADPEASPATNQKVRIALYNSIEKYLPMETRDYWNGKKDRDISFGLNFVGRNDQIAAHVQQKLQALEIYPFQTPLAEADFERFKTAFTETLTTGFIRAMFDIEGEVAAQRISAQATAIAQYYFDALIKPGSESNYFVTTFFANRYAASAGDQGMPGYLSPGHYAALQKKLTENPPQWITGNLLGYMQELSQSHPFDLISVSNIPDWMDNNAYLQMLKLADTCLNKGGAVIARKATGGDRLEDLTATVFKVDKSLNARLLSVERGPMWKDIVAGVK